MAGGLGETPPGGCATWLKPADGAGDGTVRRLRLRGSCILSGGCICPQLLGSVAARIPLGRGCGGGWVAASCAARPRLVPGCRPGATGCGACCWRLLPPFGTAGSGEGIEAKCRRGWRDRRPGGGAKSGGGGGGWSKLGLFVPEPAGTVGTGDGRTGDGRRAQPGALAVNGDPSEGGPVCAWWPRAACGDHGLRVSMGLFSREESDLRGVDERDCNCDVGDG